MFKRDLRLMCDLYTLVYGLFGTLALHLLYLSVLCPFMFGGPGPPPDYVSIRI